MTLTLTRRVAISPERHARRALRWAIDTHTQTHLYMYVNIRRKTRRSP